MKLFDNFQIEKLNFDSPNNLMNILHRFLSVSLSTNIFGFLCKNYDNNGYVAPSYDEEPSSSGNKIKMKLKEFHRRYSETTTSLNVCVCSWIVFGISTEQKQQTVLFYSVLLSLIPLF